MKLKENNHLIYASNERIQLVIAKFIDTKFYLRLRLRKEVDGEYRIYNLIMSKRKEQR